MQLHDEAGAAEQPRPQLGQQLRGARLGEVLGPQFEAGGVGPRGRRGVADPDDEVAPERFRPGEGGLRRGRRRRRPLRRRRGGRRRLRRTSGRRLGRGAVAARPHFGRGLVLAAAATAPDSHASSLAPVEVAVGPHGIEAPTLARRRDAGERGRQGRGGAEGRRRPGEAGFASGALRADRRHSGTTSTTVCCPAGPSCWPATARSPIETLRPARRRGGPADRARHDLPHLLDDQADHVGGGADAVGGGRLRAEGPGVAVRPVVRRHPGLAGRLGPEPGHRSDDRADAPSGTCSPTPSGLTYGFHSPHPVDELYRRAGFEWDVAAGRRPGRRVRPPGGAAAAVPARHASGTTASPPTCSAGSSRWPRASRSTSSSRERIFEPLGMVDTGFSVPRGRAVTAWPRSTCRTPGTRQGHPPRHAWATARSRRPSFLSGGGGLVSTAPTTTASRRCWPRGGELDGVRLLGTAHGRATWPRTTCPAAPT